MHVPPAAILDIDLDAVAANWVELGRRHPSGPVAAVVKADAYGLGAGKVVSRLVREGCRHVFTAHPEEALAIRDIAPGAMLGVLNGLLPGAAALYREKNLLPTLGSLPELAEWRAEAARAGAALPALLHVDTGMNRLGLSVAELDAVAADPSLLEGVDIRFVMTHLVAAEMPGDPVNEAQRRRFAAACARLPPAPKSLANSSGIFLGPDFASDLARPGAALYGINPTPGRPNPMRNPVRLRARVLQVREVAAGETVGYNGQWVAPRPSRIATAALGYADGFLRALGNKARAYFDGSPVPLVGRVSMDLTTFDATDHTAIGPGAWLELIGAQSTPDDLAVLAGTNGYEILTALGRRYHRRYHGT
jgi:alanine racemase